MDFIHKWQVSALLFDEYCIMHIVMEVYVVRWARRNFRVTWMSIVNRVLANYFYWPRREMYSELNPPLSSLMLKLLISRQCCWEHVCGIICALSAYCCVSCTEMCKMYTWSLHLLSETPRYATANNTMHNCCWPTPQEGSKNWRNTIICKYS